MELQPPIIKYCDKYGNTEAENLKVFNKAAEIRLTSSIYEERLKADIVMQKLRPYLWKTVYPLFYAEGENKEMRVKEILGDSRHRGVAGTQNQFTAKDDAILHVKTDHEAELKFKQNCGKKLCVVMFASDIKMSSYVDATNMADIVCDYYIVNGLGDENIHLFERDCFQIFKEVETIPYPDEYRRINFDTLREEGLNPNIELLVAGDFMSDFFNEVLDRLSSKYNFVGWGRDNGPFQFNHKAIEMFASRNWGFSVVGDRSNIGTSYIFSGVQNNWIYTVPMMFHKFQDGNVHTVSQSLKSDKGQQAVLYTSYSVVKPKFCFGDGISDFVVSNSLGVYGNLSNKPGEHDYIMIDSMVYMRYDFSDYQLVTEGNSRGVRKGVFSRMNGTWYRYDDSEYSLDTVQGDNLDNAFREINDESQARGSKGWKRILKDTVNNKMYVMASANQLVLKKIK